MRTARVCFILLYIYYIIYNIVSYTRREMYILCRIAGALGIQIFPRVNWKTPGVIIRNGNSWPFFSPWTLCEARAVECLNNKNRDLHLMFVVSSENQKPFSTF